MLISSCWMLIRRRTTADAEIVELLELVFADESRRSLFELLDAYFADEYRRRLFELLGLANLPTWIPPTLIWIAGLVIRRRILPTLIRVAGRLCIRRPIPLTLIRFSWTLQILPTWIPPTLIRRAGLVIADEYRRRSLKLLDAYSLINTRQRLFELAGTVKLGRLNTADAYSSCWTRDRRQR